MKKKLIMLFVLLAPVFAMLNSCSSDCTQSQPIKDIAKAQKKQMENELASKTVTYTSEVKGHEYVITVYSAYYGGGCAMVHSESCSCKSK